MKQDLPIQTLTSTLIMEEILRGIEGEGFFYLLMDLREGYPHFYGTFGGNIIAQRNTEIYPDRPFVVNFDDPNHRWLDDGYYIYLRYKEEEKEEGEDREDQNCRYLRNGSGCPFLVIEKGRIFIRRNSFSQEFLEQPIDSLRIVKVIQ